MSGALGRRSLTSPSPVRAPWSIHTQRSEVTTLLFYTERVFVIIYGLPSLECENAAPIRPTSTGRPLHEYENLNQILKQANKQTQAGGKHRETSKKQKDQ